jgi:hypothetical protein
MSDGDPLLISGANQSDYNGIFQASYSSTTVVTIEVSGSPVTPATGTLLGFTYTDSYFKFSKYTNANGSDVVLHETDGHLYTLSSSLSTGMPGVPIEYFGGQQGTDGGTTRAQETAARLGCRRFGFRHRDDPLER